MSKESLPLLLFDLGGVLIENQTFERLEQLVDKDFSRDELKDRWLASNAIRQFELGLVPPAEFAIRFLHEWKIDMRPSDFIQEFEAWPLGFYKGAKVVLQQLRRKFRLACLSNSNELHWNRFGGFAGQFDVAMSSHLIHAIKPDQAAFEQALLFCGVEAGEVIFFDDSRANVDAAEHIGLQAFHVDGFEHLRGVLRRELNADIDSAP